MTDERPLVRTVVTVTATGPVRVGSCSSYAASVDDGTRQFDLVFLGRAVVGGLDPGRRCWVEGRLGQRVGRAVMWNPHYRLLPDDDATSTPVSPVGDASSTAAGPHRAAPTVGASATGGDGAGQVSRPPVGDGDGEAPPLVAATGRFRIYLGMAAGVGKTFAMLDEGHRRAWRGRDVVVGVVDTHGRPGTQAQLDGLEVVPPRLVEHHGTKFEELDVEAVIERRPDVVLVDELAHSVVAGSGGRDKRWQDVLELLSAGISVVTTLNVQHIESLADVVEHITGVRVRERVPDAVVRAADQIELVDSSPEQLRRRMMHGNVYPPDRVGAALTGFFDVGNLSALRELTLRFLADEVDETLLSRLQARTGHCACAPDVGERVLVAVSSAPSTETTLRRAGRIAHRLKAPLTVVHVRPSDAPHGASEHLDRVRDLAGRLGAEWSEVEGDDPPTALVSFALAHAKTQIVVGAPSARRWHLSRDRSTARLTRLATDAGIDVHIVPPPGLALVGHRDGGREPGDAYPPW